MESRRAQLEARALANRRPRTPGEMRGDRNHSPTHGDDLARGSAMSRRSDDDITEAGGAPVDDEDVQVIVPGGAVVEEAPSESETYPRKVLDWLI